MFKPIIIAFVALFSILNLNAQDPESFQRDSSKPKTPFRERIYFGGGGGLMLGNVGYIQASPIVGYKLNQKASVGIGGDLMYLFGDGWSVMNYGGNLFTRYQVSNEFFVQGEYSIINTYTALQKREWVGTALAGIGYFPSRGVNISALYILNYDPDRTPYVTFNGLPILLRISFIL